MSHRLRLWIFLLSACAAACPWSLAQESGQSNSSVSRVAPQDAPAQLRDLLKQCFDEINVHGNFVRAEEVARQARDLSQKTGDKRSEAEAMVYLGAAIGYQGRAQESLEIAKQTLVVARESGDKKVVEQALNNLGSVTGGLGRYEESVGYFYALHDLAREINDPVMEYMSLLNMGEAYSSSGEPGRAESPLLQALKLAGELNHGDPASRAKSKKGTEMALLNLAGMEMARGHYAAALRYFERVHESQPGTPLWAIAALQGMANADQQLGKPQEAIPLFEQAIALAEKSPGGGYQVAMVTSNLGVSQETTGRLDAALASQQHALNLFHTAGGDPEAEWQIESHIGHVLRAMGHNEEALEHYKEAIGDVERLRLVALNNEEGHAEAVAKSHDTYSETADLLVDLHRDSEAFAMAERGRARSFLDTLAVARAGLAEQHTPEQDGREQKLLKQISAAQAELWKGGLSAKEQQERKAKLVSAEEELEAFQVEVRRSNPRYASLRYPEPTDIAQVQNELLDDKTVLLEFLLCEKRSLVWAIARDQVTVRILPARKQIEQQVNDYRKLLSDRGSVLTLQQSLEKIDKSGSALYATLLAPLRGTLRSGERLIIIPDGALDYLPFETLVTGTGRDAAGQNSPRYALELFSISYGPSASALLAVRTDHPQESEWNKLLLAFGDPVPEPAAAKEARSSPAFRSAGGEAAGSSDAPGTATDRYAERGFSLARLPFTREEVLSIARLFPASRRQLYLGGEATEDAVRSENLGQYRYIHFATHGFLDESAPGRSGIMFSRAPGSQQAGILLAGEVMRLKMDADLVTLSACSTGLGEMVNGEGILGLTRAFFYAGARNLTVSLWNVNDSATSALMRAFYARLNRGAAKPEALREAKLQLLRGSNTAWRNPYFWGAFVLVGEGN